MTVQELIDQLKQWPMEASVDVSIDAAGRIGSGRPAAIVGVSGYAGGHISGRDSGVSIKVATAPTFNAV
jgi:hypothetical protein